MSKKHHLKDHLESAVQSHGENTVSRNDTEQETNEQSVPQEHAADLAEELKAAVAERDSWKDRALRMQADMENLRKRMAHDMENHTKFAHANFAKDLLPVADCLANALDCAKKGLEHPDDQSFLKNMITGIEMVQKQLDDVLKKHGIEKMDSLGKLFDPNLHQVIGQIDDTGKEPGTIVQEMQTGYIIGGDRVLREALVLVAK